MFCWPRVGGVLRSSEARSRRPPWPRHLEQSWQRWRGQRGAEAVHTYTYLLAIEFGQLADTVGGQPGSRTAPAAVVSDGAEEGRGGELGVPVADTMYPSARRAVPFRC
jgi:hypothetical protein